MLLPRLYLGTMTFAWNQASVAVDTTVATSFVKKFVQSTSSSLLHVDTARIYSGGDTEPMVKEALAQFSGESFLLGTKAHPSQPDGLSQKGLMAQFDASCAALGTDSFEEYYLHQPDPESSLEESLRCTDALVRDGRVARIGMSNYHAAEVARAMELCEREGLVKPSVYQGLYNPLNRAVEEELLPVLRRHGCAFIAYNPLAAGLLTGTHTSAEALKTTPGRFKDNPNYLPRFGTKQNFEALQSMREACDAAGMSLVEATYKWLLRHSALSSSGSGEHQQRNGVLIGASSMSHLEQNLAACAAAASSEPEDGQLPPAVLAAFDGAWTSSAALRDGAFPYWRSYSADMPNRDALHPGASYDAAKTKK